MIDGCFLHCKGIGPRTSDELRRAGYDRWDDCLERSGALPLGAKKKEAFLRELDESRRALADDDIGYFLRRLPCAEHWRILARYHDRATWFDIETTGLSWHSCYATVIVALHKGRLHRFIHGENLDEFLDLVDDAELLASFNGNCFDIPVLEKTFNLPGLGVPHLDVRWVGYHQGYRGGLKWIEKDIGVSRPSHIRDIDGFEAIDLFFRWQQGDAQARELLLTYCSYDTLAACMLGQRVLYEKGVIGELPVWSAMVEDAWSCAR